ncbi:Hint domain-containing protein [Methylomagnum sp.]
MTTYNGPFDVMAQATDGNGNEWYLLTDGSHSFLVSEHLTTFTDPPYEFTNATLLDNPGVVCFLEGTRVLTRDGYAPIESLTPGDELLTLGGAWLPLCWLGRLESCQGRLGYKPSDLPIRIARDAFGVGLPVRDLLVSPDHAVFFRHHLIPAKCLVNGTTVRRESRMERLVYYHALLDSHAVIFSEALPTESYVPRENQRFFSNADSLPVELPTALLSAAGWVKDCYPRVTSGPVVTAACAHLARLVPESELGQVA